ncbi:hypothetical protein MGP2080_05280 [marine gamma proteobacterium HTCC2080]|nr:hypothetical protein MGP2080_05280 [marine gamma proteobacterium HTCC2080]
MATASEIKVTEAYIGLLGRAPDPEGLAYWVAQLDAAGGTDDALKKLTNDITLSEEWDSGIGANKQADGSINSADATNIVTKMYDNLFDREPTAADITYWGDQLVAGTVTASEMAVLLIVAANEKGTADGQTMAFKREAASYYAEAATQEQYLASKGDAKSAVSSVNGPQSLQDSKEATDALTSGEGETTVFTTAASETATVTLGDDTVTGTVGGTAATYAATDTVADKSSGDSDTFTITGDANVAFGTVTNVEAVNVNLGKQNGSAPLTLSNVDKVTGSTINVTLDEKVTIAGVEVPGETSLKLTGALTSDLNTVNVAAVEAVVGGGAATISGDVDLASITLTGVDANDTTLVIADNDSAVTLVGTDKLTDAVTIQAAGDVALNVSTGGGEAVEALTLSGVGGAVDYAVSGVNAASSTSYTITGDQNVTLSAASGQLKDATITNSGSGTLAVDLTGVATVDLSTLDLAGGLELSAKSVDDATIGVKAGTAVTIDTLQDEVLTFDANDTATDSALAITLTNDVTDGGVTAGISTTDFDTVSIALGSRSTTIDILDMSANDAALTITGTNDVTVLGATSSGDLTVSGKVISLTGALDVDGNLTLVGSNDINLGTAAVVDNDVSVTAVGNATAKAIDATSGTADIAAVKIDLNGTLTAQNDITLTSSNDTDVQKIESTNGGVTATAAGKFTATDDIQSSDGGNVSLTATLALAGTTVDASAGSTTLAGDSVNFSGLVDGQNDVTITATNDVDLDGVTSSNGNVSITGNTIDNASLAITAAGNITLTATNDTADSVIGDAVTTAAGTVTLANGNFDATAKVITGNSVVISGDAKLKAGIVTADSVTVTSSCDVTFTELREQTAGDGIVLSGASATGDITATIKDDNVAFTGLATLITGTGDDDITLDEAAVFSVTTGEGADTVTLTEVKVGTVVNTGAGADIIAGNATGAGYTLSTGGGDDIITLDAGGMNDVVVDGGAEYDTVNLDGDYNTAAAETFTLANIEEIVLANNTTIKAAAIASDSTFKLSGDKVLTVVAADVANEVIDLSAITLNGLSTPTNFILTGGSKADTIKAALEATSTIQGGDGNDIIVGGETIDTVGGDDGDDNISGGKGADILDGDDGDDIISGGDGDDIIQGGNDDDTITGNDGADTLKGDAGDDSIDGGAGVDIITGGTGVDTLTGGTGADKYSFVAGDSKTDAAGAATFDSIVDYATGEEIDGPDNVTQASAATEASGTAGLGGAGQLATFNDADNTFALRVVAVEKAIQATDNTAGEAAHFMYGGDTYVFITDGTDGVDANDIIVKLTGVDATAAGFDTLTVANNNATLA